MRLTLSISAAQLTGDYGTVTVSGLSAMDPHSLAQWMPSLNPVKVISYVIVLDYTACSVDVNLSIT